MLWHAAPQPPWPTCSAWLRPSHLAADAPAEGAQLAALGPKAKGVSLAPVMQAGEVLLKDSMHSFKLWASGRRFCQVWRACRMPGLLAVRLASWRSLRLCHLLASLLLILPFCSCRAGHAGHAAAGASPRPAGLYGDGAAGPEGRAGAGGALRCAVPALLGCSAHAMMAVGQREGRAGAGAALCCACCAVL